MLNLNNISPNDRQYAVDNQIQCITYRIHSAAESASKQPRTFIKPKPYWCPQFSMLRDKKRFWWHLWTSNNRPRSGVVYHTYKNIKKMFPRYQRQYINKQQNGKAQNLTNLFRCKRLTQFWNCIKLRKKVKTN